MQASFTIRVEYIVYKYVHKFIIILNLLNIYIVHNSNIQCVLLVNTPIQMVYDIAKRIVSSSHGWMFIILFINKITIYIYLIK